MMARIRTLKPEFFTSHDIVSMTPLARLFYASLWCESDREGRLKWSTKTLKIRYFPVDDCDLDRLAQELIERGNLILYEVDGKKYAFLPNFTTHQVINNREAQSFIPPLKGRERKGRKGSHVRDATLTRELPDWIEREPWDNWIEMRKKQKKPPTEAAIKLAINTLDKLRSEGNNPTDVLNQSTFHSWQGLFPVKDSGSSANGKPKTAFDQSLEPAHEGDGEHGED
jgi:hypothetical protein